VHEFTQDIQGSGAQVIDRIGRLIEREANQRFRSPDTMAAQGRQAKRGE
jgi:hypothetical protein